jgi:hypothetical protein
MQYPLRSRIEPATKIKEKQMGRPLKIAKAQAVLTVTDTAQTGSIVTVTQNLTTTPTVGVIAGMPFQVATTVGGLTAGTTYYINSILSNNTFDVSETQLSVQPQVMATLTDTTSQSVSASVNVVDYGFNNPDNSNTSAPTGSNESFGVVGGNTAIVGPQTTITVAIGRSGTGNIFSSTASNLVYGAGTDFANTLSTGSAIQAVDAYGTATNLGFATATFGYVSVAVANTVVSGNVIGTTGNALTLAVDQPVSFSANLGTLVAGTTYFVKTTANASAFTVSDSLGGAPKVMTAATGTPNALQDRILLAANAAATVTGLGQNYVYANDEAGFLVRQKGKTKYLATGLTTGLTAPCYTANVTTSALTPNTLSIVATYADTTTAFVSSLNDYQTQVFPTQIADGSLTPGSLYTIYYSGDTDWTSIGAASNMTGVTFTALSAGGSGTGTAILAQSSGETTSQENPDVISSFNTAYAANTYPGQPNPVVVISNA